MKPRVLILRVAGTNCDFETEWAFNLCGAYAERIHINQIIRREKKLSDYQILVIPGGFSYGDDIAAGKVLANQIKLKLWDEVEKFIQDKKVILGICNGFQVLVKSGILPFNTEQLVTLEWNDSGRFEDRWVYLFNTQYSILNKESKCIWTKDIPKIIYLPVAHAEGKFVVKDNSVLERLKNKGQIVFQYCDKEGNLKGYPYNPNGSYKNIAGICDESGRIFGLMPHPERHIDYLQHPRWYREKEADGLKIFRNGLDYAKK